MQCLLVATLFLTLDPIIEMNLELGPSGFNIEPVYFLAQRLRVLVALLQMIRSKTNKVDLQGHSFPLFRAQFAD